MHKPEKYLVAALLCISTAVVADSTRFHGTWGSALQCSRDLITPKGTKHAAPFEISADWLQHGNVWCRLNWNDVVVNQDVVFGAADALCGEDDNRSYQINFKLVESELTIAWNSEYSNRQLLRCLK